MHTQGPWKVGSSDGAYSLMVYCDDATGQRIADCTNNLTDHTFEEKQANARLIAAAPDLLVALERIADPRNIHFAGDAQVVAQRALHLAKHGAAPATTNEEAV